MLGLKAGGFPPSLLSFSCPSAPPSSYLVAFGPDFRNSRNIPCSSLQFSLKPPLFSYYLDSGLNVNPSNPLVARIAGPFLTTTTALPAPEASRRALQVPALPCCNDRAVWACAKASLCGAIPSRSLGMRSFPRLLPPSSLPQETEGGVPHTFPASYCLPCCREPLHFDQGPWKRNKAFLGH